MAFQDDALLNILEQSETADWPTGLVYVVVDDLFNKYKPSFKKTSIDNIPLFHCVSKRVSPSLTLYGSSFLTMSNDAQEFHIKGIDPPGQTIHPGTLPPLFPSTRNPAFLFNCGSF
jgi:hypothetical protein